MNVITLKPHRYKNKQKLKGDKYEFKGTKQELRLALALWVKPYEEKNAEVSPQIVAEQSPTIVINATDDASFAATDSEVEQVSVTIPEDESKVIAEVTYKPRRTYKRRDMVSDE